MRDSPLRIVALVHAGPVVANVAAAQPNRSGRLPVPLFSSRLFKFDEPVQTMKQIDSVEPPLIVSLEHGDAWPGLK